MGQGSPGFGDNLVGDGDFHGDEPVVYVPPRVGSKYRECFFPAAPASRGISPDSGSVISAGMWPQISADSGTTYSEDIEGSGLNLLG